jgi:hypothetical protein
MKAKTMRWAGAGMSVPEAEATTVWADRAEAAQSPALASMLAWVLYR